MKKITKTLVALSAALCLSVGLGTFAACNTKPADHTHTYTEWGKDDTNHWKYCPDDDTIDEATRAQHSYGADDKCECGQEKPVPTFTITFNSKGGSAVPSQTVNEGDYPDWPDEDPTRAGYIFKGWYVDEDYEEEFDFYEEVTEDITVYAKWAKAYTVSFNTGDGGSKITDQVMERGDKATKPKQDPTRNGYAFKGWFTSSDYDTEFNFVDTVIEEDTVVYAKWIALYTVTFVTGEGSQVEAQVLEDGSLATQPEEDPTRENYEFAGWYTTADYDFKFNFKKPITQHTSVYAKWLLDGADYSEGDWVIEKGRVKTYSGSFDNIEIPAALTKLDSILEIFNKAANIKTCTNMTVAAENTALEMKNNALVSKDGKTLYFYVGGADTPTWADVTAIAPYAFYSRVTTAENLTFGNLKTVGDYAFYGCTGITSFDKFERVPQFGPYAFATSGLTGVTIRSAFELGDHLFYQCTSLESVDLSEAPLTELPSFCFGGTNKTNVPLTSIQLPSNLKSLGSSAFSYCKSLASITLPAWLETIENSVFSNCVALTEVTLPSSVKSLGNSVFSGCTLLATISLNEGLENLGNSVFAKCAFTSIVIPDTVTSFGTSVFDGCASLTSVKLPKDIKTITNSMFAGCSSLTSFELPSSVTEIGSKAFNNCTSLATFVIPEDTQLQKLGGEAFAYTLIEKLVLPETVTEMAYDMTTYMKSLKYLDLPSGVTTLRSTTGNSTNIFWNVPLEVLILRCTTLVPLGTNHNLKYFNTEVFKIYVPAELVDAYKTASFWSEVADYFVNLNTLPGESEPETDPQPEPVAALLPSKRED